MQLSKEARLFDAGTSCVHLISPTFGSATLRRSNSFNIELRCPLDRLANKTLRGITFARACISMTKQNIDPQSTITFVLGTNTSLSQTGPDYHDNSLPAAFAPDFARIPPWKRGLDISSLLIALPILLPITLLIAIVIKVGSKGPVLFRQERVGLLGRKFTLFKFRTMIAGANMAVHETHVVDLIETDKPMTKLDARGDARTHSFWTYASRGWLR